MPKDFANDLNLRRRNLCSYTEHVVYRQGTLRANPSLCREVCSPAQSMQCTVEALSQGKSESIPEEFELLKKACGLPSRHSLEAGLGRVHGKVTHDVLLRIELFASTQGLRRFVIDA